MTTDLSAWSERQRLLFIERLLYWKGCINRRDLRDHFGISPPQATNDLVKYTTLNPGACAYNVRSKRYEVTADMAPLLIEPDFGTDMAALGAAAYPDGVEDFVCRPDYPQRTFGTALLRQLCLAAHCGYCIDMCYWSVNSGSSSWRTISPLAFGCDGLRWHVRAFCHKRKDFRDFNIGRIEALRDPRVRPESVGVDTAWHAWLRLDIRPNPRLNAATQKAMAMDYAMKDGVLHIYVREAMALYTQRRLGFVREPKKLPMLNEMEHLEWFATQAVAGGCRASPEQIAK